jgi:AraC family transcriptional regulator, transcriptional activator of pobA
MHSLYPARAGIQYHSRESSGFFLAVNPDDIPGPAFSAFGSIETQNLPINKESGTLTELLKGIQEICRNPMPKPFHISAVKSLLNAFIILIAAVFSEFEKGVLEQTSGSKLIALQFKKLLREKSLVLRKSSHYADRLNLSTAYLNKILKGETGHPGNYWTQQEVMLEAKGLLFHTELTTKEVAVNLDFADPPYFTRLFKMVNGITPERFREKGSM